MRSWLCARACSLGSAFSQVGLFHRAVSCISGPVHGRRGNRRRVPHVLSHRQGPLVSSCQARARLNRPRRSARQKPRGPRSGGGPLHVAIRARCLAPRVLLDVRHAASARALRGGLRDPVMRLHDEQAGAPPLPPRATMPAAMSRPGDLEHVQPAEPTILAESPARLRINPLAPSGRGIAAAGPGLRRGGGSGDGIAQRPSTPAVGGCRDRPRPGAPDPARGPLDRAAATPSGSSPRGRKGLAAPFGR